MLNQDCSLEAATMPAQSAAQKHGYFIPLVEDIYPEQPPDKVTVVSAAQLDRLRAAYRRSFDPGIVGEGIPGRPDLDKFCVRLGQRLGWSVPAPHF
jgi:hypothetical protein